MKLFALLLVAASAAAYGHSPEASQPFDLLHAHEQVEGHIHTGWDNRYFSEGRDMLDGDSLWTSSAELGWNHLAGGVWYGRSADQNYDELQLSLALTGHAGDFEFYAAYTHLRFPVDGSEDNEVGGGLLWNGLPLEAKLGLDAYYSFDAEGWFSELFVTREFGITEKLAVELSAVFGFNFGYVADGHDGANHIALRLAPGYALSDSLSLTVHVTSNWALDKDRSAPGDDLLTDFVHAGIGIEWTF